MNNPSLYLSLLDKTKDCFLYGYITFSGLRFLLMSETARNEDSVKEFFQNAQKLIIMVQI